MSDAAIIGVAAFAIVAGIGTAAFILRYEFRYQLRQRRHGGYITGGPS